MSVKQTICESEWIDVRPIGNGFIQAKCRKCGRVTRWIINEDPYRYCPRCGIRMLNV